MSSSLALPSPHRLQSNMVRLCVCVLLNWYSLTLLIISTATIIFLEPPLFSWRHYCKMQYKLTRLYVSQETEPVLCFSSVMHNVPSVLVYLDRIKGLNTVAHFLFRGWTCPLQPGMRFQPIHTPRHVNTPHSCTS